MIVFDRFREDARWKRKENSFDNNSKVIEKIKTEM